MKEINEAYEVLSNDFLREQYDMELEKEEILKYKATLKNQKEKQAKEQKDTRKNIDSDKAYKIGTFSAVRELSRRVFENMPHVKWAPTKKGMVAVILTAIVIIILGIVLWFIPFTNGWIRELTVENPLFSWMFS